MRKWLSAAAALFLLIHFTHVIAGGTTSAADAPVEMAPFAYEAPEGLPFGDATFEELWIMHDDREVIYQLQPKWSCPEGMNCTAVMPPKRSFRAAIVATAANECNVTNLVAVEGDLQIRIQDYRQAKCDTRPAAEQTEVTFIYRKKTAGSFKTSALQPTHIKEFRKN